MKHFNDIPNKDQQTFQNHPILQRQNGITPNHNMARHILRAHHSIGISTLSRTTCEDCRDTYTMSFATHWTGELIYSSLPKQNSENVA